MEGSLHAKKQLDSSIFVSIQCRLVTEGRTDGQTERQADTRRDSIYRVSTASRGKNNNLQCIMTNSNF